MEGCIGNQTFKDKRCLIPCSGLYADTEDDSLKHDMAAFEQYMQTGRLLCEEEGSYQTFLNFQKSGLKSLIEELKAASYSLRKLHVPDLEFYESSRRKEDGLKSLTEEYINYKQGFVKHLHFDPEAENRSE